MIVVLPQYLIKTLLTQLRFLERKTLQMHFKVHNIDHPCIFILLVLDFLPVEFQIIPDLTFYHPSKVWLNFKFCQIELFTSLIVADITTTYSERKTVGIKIHQADRTKVDVCLLSCKMK